MSSPAGSTPPTAVAAMLEARSIAIVGASPRPMSFGDRLLTELERSPSSPRIHLVNPRYDKIGTRHCLPSLSEITGPVDLVALGVGDHALEEQLTLAASRGDRSAIVYGNAFGPARSGSSLRERLRSIAVDSQMALCGAGCMGFVNVAKGLRAIGYLEPEPLPAGPIALITHSGSAFSALLRADRRFGWSLAVSSGQELVTTTADYVDYALGLDQTRVIALLVETLRAPERLRAVLRRAAEADVAVVAVAVGASPGGRAMVEAHSGALAGDDVTWEALCDSTGVVRVRDLAEMTDTLELFAAGRRSPAPSRGLAADRGIASVHDSGAERALGVDLAHHIGVPFAEIGSATRAKLAELVDDGLVVHNPLDVWGTGASTRQVFAGSLIALAEDPAVDAVALCVDLVAELDGDTSYQDAVLDAWSATTVPLCVVCSIPSAIDRIVARQLRDAGIPVLEGTASGLAALGHLVSLEQRRQIAVVDAPPIDEARRDRWLPRLGQGPLSAVEGFALIADYDIASPATRPAHCLAQVLDAGEQVGYPVVLKCDRPDIAHKSDVGGVVLGLVDRAGVAEAYDDMSDRLGPDVIVAATAPPGAEMALGILRDPLLGPVVIIGAGGVLVEVLADRRLGLPPIDGATAMRMMNRLSVAAVLAGARGGPVADLGALAAAVVGLSQLAMELGDAIAAVDLNPLRCGPYGVLALDVLIETRRA